MRYLSIKEIVQGVKYTDLIKKENQNSAKNTIKNISKMINDMTTYIDTLQPKTLALKEAFKKSDTPVEKNSGVSIQEKESFSYMSDSDTDDENILEQLIIPKKPSKTEIKINVNNPTGEKIASTSTKVETGPIIKKTKPKTKKKNEKNDPLGVNTRKATLVIKRRNNIPGLAADVSSCIRKTKINKRKSLNSTKNIRNGTEKKALDKYKNEIEVKNVLNIMKGEKDDDKLPKEIINMLPKIKRVKKIPKKHKSNLTSPLKIEEQTVGPLTYKLKPNIKNVNRNNTIDRNLSTEITNIEPRSDLLNPPYPTDEQREPFEFIEIKAENAKIEKEVPTEKKKSFKYQLHSVLDNLKKKAENGEAIDKPKRTRTFKLARKYSNLKIMKSIKKSMFSESVTSSSDSEVPEKIKCDKKDIDLFKPVNAKNDKLISRKTSYRNLTMFTTPLNSYLSDEQSSTNSISNSNKLMDSMTTLGSGGSDEITDIAIRYERSFISLSSRPSKAVVPIYKDSSSLINKFNQQKAQAEKQKPKKIKKNLNMNLKHKQNTK